MEVQNGVKDIFVLRRRMRPLNYFGEKSAIKDQLEPTQKRISLAL